jgi:hypothetical protein
MTLYDENPLHPFHRYSCCRSEQQQATSSSTFRMKVKAKADIFRTKLSEMKDIAKQK